MDDWQSIETAPQDKPIIGGYFGDKRSARWGDVVVVWWQPEFEAFISSCRQMTMASGYTINGKQSELHSPVIEKVTHFMPYNPPKISQ